MLNLKFNTLIMIILSVLLLFSLTNTVCAQENNTNNMDDVIIQGTYGELEKEINNLEPGETIIIDVKYKKDHFRVLNPDLQYSDAYMTAKDIIAIILVIAIFIIVVAVLIISVTSQQDPYMRERGFVGRGYYFHRHRYYRRGYYSSGRKIERPTPVNTSGYRGVGGGSSCACACACACAGGGRAGCSMKDFYKHPKLEQIKKALDK